MTHVGIVDVDRYSPERFMTAAEIARLSGIPEEILRDRFGIVGKHVAGRDEHVSDMCIAAARKVVERNPGRDIDAVVYFGSHWKDYLVWQVAPKIQYALGIDGYSLEFINVSAGAPIALRMAKSLLVADGGTSSLLLVGASKESHLLDYTNQRSRFMFNFGDGAVAALLARDHDRNHVLESGALTDASFSDHVRVPAGGSVLPASHDTVKGGLHSLDVKGADEMKRRLDPISIKNFVKVAREAVERSGYSLDDVGWLLPIHMKRSIHDALLLELGIPTSRAVYLDHYGHMSAVDPLFSLSMARDEERLAPGDLVLLIAAGTGYSWTATLIRWG